MGSKLKTASNKKAVICVDLDDTLIKTDLLFEAVFQYLKKFPLRIVSLIAAVFSGKVNFKHFISKDFEPSVDNLPYNQDLLKYLKTEKARGAHLVLATASPQSFAEKIAKHLNIFDQVFGSTKQLNLKGTNKKNLLVENYGANSFIYVGDSNADLQVWTEASEAILVGNNKSLENKLTNLNKLKQVIPGNTFNFSQVIKTFRVYQWVKNLLLFVPIIMAHKLFYPQAVWATCLGFVAFSLVASAGYVFNDLFDLNSDRVHPQKSKRPIASGAISSKLAVWLALGNILIALLISFLLPIKFAYLLITYLLLSLLYSQFFKNLLALDIIFLASFYALRILAGGLASSTEVSPWLLAFSVFMFLSLACLKRYSELIRLKKSFKTDVAGRAYTADDLELVGMFGISSGYLATLVFALYLNSDHVRTLYSKPLVLWILCPVMLYWISRVWLLARRAEVMEDPVLFALKDRTSYIVALIAFLLIFFAA